MPPARGPGRGRAIFERGFRVREKDRIGRGARLAVPLVAVLIGSLAGCNNNDNGDTVNVNGLDCGLVRDDLIGTWRITYTPATRTLTILETSRRNTRAGATTGTRGHSSRSSPPTGLRS